MFRALHERPGIFSMPPGDAGTAKLFEPLGCDALATTSRGLANARGSVDGTLAIEREALIANCRDIADLENGYAEDPAQAAEIIRLAADAGVVGDSLEDAIGDPANPI